MNVSDATVKGSDLFQALARDASFPYLMRDIAEKIKKSVLADTTMQFGQIMSLLFPSQMSRVLKHIGHTTEAELIREWFVSSDGWEHGGMLNIIPGAWQTDRIVKYICRTESLNFCWVDQKLADEQSARFGLPSIDATDEIYSQPLSHQMGGIGDRLAEKFNKAA